MQRPKLASLGKWSTPLAAGVVLFIVLSSAYARPPIRKAFFQAYPQAKNTQLDDLPSNPGHCGVCHYDFNGGGTRNPYGLLVEGTPNRTASEIAALGTIDAEGDGFTTDIEVDDPGNNYDNTPTFPGLSVSNYGQITNVDLADVTPYLTPSSGSDTEPPVVTVVYPAGGESLGSSSQQTIQWTATDNSGAVVSVDVWVTFDNGVHYEALALGVSNSGSLTWFVQNRPTTQARVLVEAVDSSLNMGSDESGDFEVYSSATGRVPTTLRDFDMPGTQPLDSSALVPPDDCRQCHADYGQQSVEPYFNWHGSMMAQASIDPAFLAALEVANQDAPESGDLCLRCHFNQGWLGGRSTPTNGSAMLPDDRIGISCDLCHRLLDPLYDPNTSPAQDVAILNALENVPTINGAAQFVIDPTGMRRGPFDDTVAPHAVIVSPFHRQAAICGTCHDVSNPAFARNPDGTYSPNAFDSPAASFGVHEIGAVERTYSEWLHSAYNTPTGVYAPDLGGNKDYVAACQDCHMRDVTGQACNEPTAPMRNDLPLHDLTGGSAWMSTVLPQFDPNRADPAALTAAAARSRDLLTKAATVDVSQLGNRLRVKVTNRTGHKLPTGYPEGRRIWLNVAFFGANDRVIKESGLYDPNTAELHHDAELKVYEIHPVVGANIAPVVGLPAGTEFHFTLNNNVAKDNRIPPLGFTNAAFEEFGGSPVNATYADGQNWDVTVYAIPRGAVRAEVTLYYQSISKEFVEFLHANATGGAGQALYDLWESNGKCPPETMATASIAFESGMTPEPDTSPEINPQKKKVTLPLP